MDEGYTTNTRDKTYPKKKGEKNVPRRRRRWRRRSCSSEGSWASSAVPKAATPRRPPSPRCRPRSSPSPPKCRHTRCPGPGWTWTGARTAARPPHSRRRCPSRDSYRTRTRGRSAACPAPPPRRRPRLTVAAYWPGRRPGSRRSLSAVAWSRSWSPSAPYVSSPRSP